MSNIDLFRNLVNLAAIDKKFTDEEIQFLAQRAEQWNIPADEFETAIVGISSGEIEVKIPDSFEDRVVMLKEMIRLMAVDGEMAEMEKEMCAYASGRMKFSIQQFAQILDEVISES